MPARSPAPPNREAIETLACENGRNSRLTSVKRETDAAVRYRKGDTDLALPLARGSPQRRRRQRNGALFGDARIVDQVFQRRAQPDGIADHECRKFFGNST